MTDKKSCDHLIGQLGESLLTESSSKTLAAEFKFSSNWLSFTFCPLCGKSLKWEPFSPDQVNLAIENFLLFGEAELVEHKESGGLGHLGYFSGDGWAARCLRWHLEQRRKSHD